MTATFVQTQIQTYLKLQNIPGLGQINRAMVIQVNPTAFLGGGTTAGATSYIWLVRNVETVISTGGPPEFQPNGWRQVRYDAFLVFDYYVLKPSTTDDTWVDGVNTMTEGVKTALRADPTLGTAGMGSQTIFTSANQFPDEGAPSINVVMELPKRTEASNILVHGEIDWPIYENVPPNPGS